MRSNGTPFLLAAAFSVVSAAAAPAGAGIEADPALPTEGEAATVIVTDTGGKPVRGVEITALYRPGSRVERSENLGLTGTDGSLTWSPSSAGLVTLSTSGDGAPALSRDLSVKYRGLPLPGLIILILAGTILYGGVIRGFRMLKSPPPILPPDT